MIKKTFYINFILHESSILPHEETQSFLYNQIATFQHNINPVQLLKVMLPKSSFERKIERKVPQRNHHIDSLADRKRKIHQNITIMASPHFYRTLCKPFRQVHID